MSTTEPTTLLQAQTASLTGALMAEEPTTENLAELRADAEEGIIRGPLYEQLGGYSPEAIEEAFAQVLQVRDMPAEQYEEAFAPVHTWFREQLLAEHSEEAVTRMIGTQGVRS